MMAASPRPVVAVVSLRRVGRYALVGSVATAAHYALLACLVERARWPAWAAAGAGAALGAQLAFVGNRVFTFAHRGPAGPAWRRFQATAFLGLLLTMALVALGTFAGWHYMVGQAVATVMVWLLTFLINRHWTFR